MVGIIELAGEYDLLSLRAAEALKSAAQIIVQSERPPCAGEIVRRYDKVSSLDALFESAQDFDSLYEAGAEQILHAGEGTVFCVIGDAGTNGFVRSLRAKNVQLELVSCGDAVQRAVFYASERNPVEAYSVIRARETQNVFVDTSVALVVEGVDNRFTAADIKLYLGNYYPEETELLFYSGKDHTWGPLSVLDTWEDFSEGLVLVLPPLTLLEKQSYGYYDLVRIMEVLRGKDGCPWDKEQTHQTLRQYLLEEAYEAVEAIDDNDMYALYDELGDVLLQVVFHAEIGRQCGEFIERDVTTSVCAKMIGRHPHIFGSVDVENADDVVRNWEAIKKKEKGTKTYTDVLRDIPRSMGALMRAYKMQKKAANVGFDFGDAVGAFQKVKEEVAELEDVLREGEEKRIEEELGDLLFAIVNVLRLTRMNPETALLLTCEKFLNRFAYIETHAGKDLKEMSLAEMDDLWERSKAKIP